MKKTLLKEQMASVIVDGSKDSHTQSFSKNVEDKEVSVEEVLVDIERESREIKRQLILTETEKKLRELDGKPLLEPDIPLPNVKPIPTDAAVQECKKLISSFQTYLGEKQKELDQEKNPPQVIQTVNKNAYEIRLHVLELAVSLRQSTQSPTFQSSPSIVSDEVLAAARAFYQFVENRR